MATGTIVCLPQAGTPPDGSASNAAARMLAIVGTNANPKRFSYGVFYDPSTEQYFWFSFPLPANYASGGLLRILWEANATSGSVVWGATVGAVTPADADTPVEHAQAAAATVTTSVNTTEARRLIESQITLTSDSMAANDLVSINVYRVAANGSDTCAVDAVVRSVALDYTTT